MAISLTIGDNGTIRKANQAKEQLTLAQLKEKTDLIKSSLELELLSGKNMIYSEELAKRLLNEFGGRIEGNVLITENDEYKISLIDDNLEVCKNDQSANTVFSDIKNSIFSYTCEIVDNKLKINITRKSFLTEIQEEFKEHVDEITTLAEKEKAIAKYMELTSDGFKGVKTIDDIVVEDNL